MMYRPLTFCLAFSLAACSATSSTGGGVKTVVVQQSINELQLEKVPGTENEIYDGAKYNSVRVPGRIDPKGVYYRAPHQALYEIRRGKYQQVQYPDGNGQYPGEK